ncbi:MAG: hypothetical protein IKC94_01310 [Lentisphaeria bacterium]|nr:hypothetical protein [Lentisphaeria bacterium]
MMIINCPKCNAAMQADESAAGQNVQCVSCQVTFQIPAPASNAFTNAQAQAAAVAGKALSGLTGGSDKIIESKFGKYLPLWFGVVAIIAIIILGVFLFIETRKHPAFDFSDDAETTACRIFEREIRESAGGCNQKAYFWKKFADSVIDDAEYEVLEKDDFAAVLIRTKANGKAVCRVIYLLKNEDGIWTQAADSNFSGADAKWKTDTEAKIRTHLSKNEEGDIKFDNVK